MTAISAHSPVRGDQVSRLWTRARQEPAYGAFWILRVGFVVLPLWMGIDKFFNTLTYWPHYLAPWIVRLLPFYAQTAMYVVGAIEIVAGSGQIPPPERAHAEEIAALCSGDRILTLIVEEVLGEFLAIVEAATLQPGEAETTEDRRVYGSAKLAAKRKGSLVELVRALGAVTLEGNKRGSKGDPEVEFERIAVG